MAEHDVSTCCCLDCAAKRDHQAFNFDEDPQAQAIREMGAGHHPNEIFATAMSAVVFRMGQMAHEQKRLADNIRELLDSFEFTAEPAEDDQ